MTHQPASAARLRHLVFAVATGVVVTGSGIAMLWLAVSRGASSGDVLLELGVAVGLSGALWWCAQRIRGQPLESRTDYSALLILAVAGGTMIALAARSGKQSQEVLVSAGAAVVTVWLFCALERQFELRETDAPLWVKIASAPLMPIMWLAFRDFELEYWPPSTPGRFNAEAVLAEIEFEHDLGSWDRDSDFRDPEFRAQWFSDDPSDLGRLLGVTPPPGFLSWLQSNTGDRRLESGTTLSVWPAALIRNRPVKLPHAVIAFAHESPAEGEEQVLLAVDLRGGAAHGSILRGRLAEAGSSRWTVSEPLEPVAKSFDAWRAAIDAGQAL